MNRKKLIFSALGAPALVLGASGMASAQELVATEAAFLGGSIDLPSFFICVVGGVLLAIGFQTLLTLLSVATGISAVGNLEKKGHHDKTYSEKNEEQYKKNHSAPLGVKISSAMGIWTLVTVSISLFFASWLAVNLSLIDVNFIGVSLGLIIWAAFFTTMVYLEIKMVSSLLGGLLNTAFSVLRGGASTLSSTFGKSHSSEMKEVAAYTVDHARKELVHMMDNQHVDRKINKWVKALKPDYKQFRKELETLISDIEIKEEQTLGKHGVTKEMFLNVTGATPSLSKRDKKKMSKMFDKIKGAAKKEGSPSDKVLAGVDKLSPGSEEDTREFRSKVEQYLRQADRDEINPDKLKKDLEQILSHPSRAPQIIMNRMSQLDKSTLVAVLEQRKDISHQDAQKYAGYAEQALNTIRSKFGNTQDKFNSMIPGGSGSSSSGSSSSNTDNYSDLRNAEIGVVRTDRGDRVEAYAPPVPSSNAKVDKETQSRVEGRLREFINKMPGQEWNYESIKSDFMNIYHDPASAPTVLQQRLKSYDRDSMITLLSSTGVVNKQTAEKMADKAVEARDEVISKAHELEDQARKRVEEAKEFALHQAENTRRSAMAAAWWLVATALVSGAAAALGGMAAL